MDSRKLDSRKPNSRKPDISRLADAPLPEPLERPIGWWLKAADAALTQAIDAAHAEDGLSRKAWQVLNAVAEHQPATLPEISVALAPIVAADELSELLANLAGRGWTAGTAERMALTAAGADAHAAILARQKIIRRRTMEGIPDEDYLRVVTTLRQMITNVGKAP